MGREWRVESFASAVFHSRLRRIFSRANVLNGKQIFAHGGIKREEGRKKSSARSVKSPWWSRKKKKKLLPLPFHALPSNPRVGKKSFVSPPRFLINAFSMPFPSQDPWIPVPRFFFSEFRLIERRGKDSSFVSSSGSGGRKNLSRIFSSFGIIIWI